MALHIRRLIIVTLIVVVVALALPGAKVGVSIARADDPPIPCGNC